MYLKQAQTLSSTKKPHTPPPFVSLISVLYQVRLNSCKSMFYPALHKKLVFGRFPTTRQTKCIINIALILVLRRILTKLSQDTMQEEVILGKKHFENIIHIVTNFENVPFNWSISSSYAFSGFLYFKQLKINTLR